jgi:RimJ/RimL family protein N-acetyltransferase
MDLKKLNQLSSLPGKLADRVQEAVLDPVVNAMVDALPEAVTSPLTGPMIVRVTSDYQHKLYEHLLSLSDSDRYLRFGFSIRDEALRNYAFHIDLDFHDVFAILDAGLQIVAMAHVAYDRKDEAGNAAEFGVSVDAAHRGKHYAQALLHRSIVHARARDVSRFYIHALSQNVPMLSLARKLGMTIEMRGDETTGYLQLPPADLSTLVDDALTDGRASVEMEVRKRARWLKQLGSASQES